MSIQTPKNTSICYQGWPVEQEDCLPALLTIGNGRIGLRGTAPELCGQHSSGTFLAGFFDALPRPEINPDTFTPFLVSWSHLDLVRQYHLEEALVNCPDLLFGWFEAEGERFVLDEKRVSEVRRMLDLQTGELVFSLPLTTASGKHADLVRRRFARMDDDRLIQERCEFLPIDFETQVIYRVQFIPDSKNCNISGIYHSACSAEDKAWYRLYDVLRNKVDYGDLYLRLRGRVRGQTAEFRSRISADAAARAEDGALVCAWNAKRGESLWLERVCAYSCSHLDGYADAATPLANACESYAQAFTKSKQVWDALWESSDVVIEGDDNAQLGIRHSLFQLLIACCRSSDRISMAAKGLSGEGYRGMVFWDTDIHMLPFFLYTQPNMAKNIVRFRCNTLNGARKKAMNYGRRGASYPWETGYSGDEECESFLKLITHQLHITADVAYGLGQYLLATEDLSFLENAVEVFVETARFWLSQGETKNGELHIPNACGPDELHLESDDNAYVCNMAAHNLALADQYLRLLQQIAPQSWQTLTDRLALCEEERKDFAYYKSHVCTMKGADGVFEQCEGFFRLRDEIVYEDSATEAPTLTQTVKQADVIMLLYLLPYMANKQELLANWNYYEPRTTHTSSLSYGVHGIIAAKLGLADKAKYYLGRSLGIDLTSTHAKCIDGLHLAADGMSWSAIVNGIAGVSFQDDSMSLAPKLPEGWTALKFTLQYRGWRLSIVIDKKHIRILCDHAGKRPLLIMAEGQEVFIHEGETKCLSH